MRMEFEKIVNEIKKLQLEEKEEIKTLIEKYIIEERRGEIQNNYKKSKKEAKKGKLGFSSDIAELKKLV